MTNQNFIQTLKENTAINTTPNWESAVEKVTFENKDFSVLGKLVTLNVPVYIGTQGRRATATPIVLSLIETEVKNRIKQAENKIETEQREAEAKAAETMQAAAEAKAAAETAKKAAAEQAEKAAAAAKELADYKAKLAAMEKEKASEQAEKDAAAAKELAEKNAIELAEANEKLHFFQQRNNRKAVRNAAAIVKKNNIQNYAAAVVMLFFAIANGFHYLPIENVYLRIIVALPLAVLLGISMLTSPERKNMNGVKKAAMFLPVDFALFFLYAKFGENATFAMVLQFLYVVAMCLQIGFVIFDGLKFKVGKQVSQKDMETYNQKILDLVD